MRILRGVAFGLFCMMGVAGLLQATNDVDAETAVSVPLPAVVTSQMLENG